MEPQERDLITTLLTRLQDASKSGQRKEPEADAMIRQAMAQMPDAPYYLVQTVLIQDLSLQNAQGRIAELEKQVASPSAPQERPTSFLGGLFGRSSPPAPAGAPPRGPWTRGPQAAPPPQQGYGPQQYAQQGYAQQPGGYAQQPGPQQQPGSGMFGGGGGSSFLRSAAATAAGVAGGALLFQGISSLFGHSYANSLGGGLGSAPGGLSETVTNNYYGDQGGGDYAGDGGGSGSDYGGGGDYGGGDYGGAGDYGGGDDYGGGSDFGGGGDNFSC